MNIDFKNILLPFDGSVQSVVALSSAVFFTKKYNAQLSIIHIEENFSDNEIKDLIDKNSQGVSYNYYQKQGKPFKMIIEKAKIIDADLIIMGTHGVSGFEEFWMGSNTYKVVNTSKCPVLSMRENNNHNDFKNIVLPIDTSFESRQKAPFAINIATKFGSTIHILGVSVETNKESEHYINTYTQQIIKGLKLHGVNYTYEKQLGGNITTNTIDYATKINADLIIIMTEQEFQYGSFFLGNFAQQMVNHSPIPVLSISPRKDMNVSDARL